MPVLLVWQALAMITWVLILFLLPTGVGHVSGFTSEAECRAAGKAAMAEVSNALGGGIRFVCVKQHSRAGTSTQPKT